MRRHLTFQLRNWFCYDPSKIKNPYLTLNINAESSNQEIKTAYYKLAKQYHPDHNPTNSQKFKQITSAYKILKDPLKKREIDSYLGKSNQNYHQQTINRTKYDTNYHYGFNRKYPNFDESKKYRYQDNPYGSSDPYFQNQFTKEWIRNTNRNNHPNYGSDQKSRMRMRMYEHNRIQSKYRLNSVLFLIFGTLATLFVSQSILFFYHTQYVAPYYVVQHLTLKDLQGIQ